MGAVILITEDNQRVLKILSFALECKGDNKVHCANDGLICVQISKKHAPDLILIDLMLPIADKLPAMGNFDVCCSLRMERLTAPNLAFIKGLGNEQRADYTQALLTCSVSRHMIAACPLAFGEVDIKERVKSVMNYKKPAFRIIVVALVACAVAAVCFLTDPVTSVRNPWVQEYVPGTRNIVGNVDKEKFEGISEDFAIGADQYGRAVFKEPYKAFDTFVGLYADGIALIRKEFNLLLPISRRNYEAYALYGWQVTSGSGEAQAQAIFVSSFLDIYENSFSEDISLSGSAPTDSANMHTRGAVKWFDYLEVPEEMLWDGYLETNRPEFPDVTFRWSYGTMSAVTETGIVQLYSGMPIWSVYFCDLTGDGLPELCSTLSFGSGLIDDRIIIYDYANGASYELADRGYYDYTLRLDNEDSCLYVDKKVYYSGEFVSSGRLIFSGGYLHIEGEAEKEMIPTAANVKGPFDAYVYVPLENGTYRYERSEIAPSSVTIGELLYSFAEKADPFDVEWNVYAVKESPDHRIIYVTAGDDYIQLYQYSPSKRVDSNALQDAKESGCIIMENGDSTWGAEQWEEFYKMTQNEKSGSVKLAHYWTLDPDRCDETYYEVYKEDYPSMHVFDLVYDGKTFTLSWTEQDAVYQRQYKYLMEYEGTIPSYLSAKTSQAVTRYVLTNDNTVTWDEISWGLVSSQFGDYIDHFSIYTDIK